MRRPSLTNHGDDMSRLTTGSTSTTSTISNSHTNNAYFPNIINSDEWQNRLKRKARQDSTSSNSQDRKLVRSNSEEQIPNICADGFRRVSSHEDFNKKPPPLHLKNDTVPITEECLKVNEQNELNKENGIIREERHSPHRDSKVHSRRHHHDDDEHERRRNNERFCRARSGGRKSSSPRKPSRHSPVMPRPIDTQVKKYEAVKFGGRGFGDEDKHHETSIGILIEDAVTKDPNTESTVIQPEEPKPWVTADEDMPVVCQRFASNTYSHAIANCDQSFAKHQAKYDLATAAAAADQPPNVFVTPEERVKQINKRLVSLKKRVSNYEESFERDYGYRPSQVDRMNDRTVKNAIAEIHKLRKEKSNIKSDPLAAMGYRTTSDIGVPKDKKLEKLKDTLCEIEKRLKEKREEDDRPNMVEELSAEQLVDEKTAIQRGLLYLESLFGRPNTRDERDAARPLYDRYRIIKRMVNRNNSLTGIGPPELPTILENEALAFTGGTITPSNDISPPSLLQSPPSESSDASISGHSIDETTTIDNDADESLGAINENIKSLSIDKLWNQLDIAREEKKQLRRSIKEFEYNFEETTGRKMLKSDRKMMEDTYAMYKQKKAKLRLLDALVKKHMNNN